ncbi:retrovirus-related pol polyprotein from transposon TNT 1-94 [Tanacetum coccineum]|uniref:Retrovirus-related pol polyprotein from transposon TNT 1-94 n=1 Tax=Tanacetum coccineum TaxID=301880 RepID=A0ABQ4WWX4_9ASTR
MFLFSKSKVVQIVHLSICNPTIQAYDWRDWNVTILRVYYIEGLGHNLFSVGQFCKHCLTHVPWRYDGFSLDKSLSKGPQRLSPGLARRCTSRRNPQTLNLKDNNRKHSFVLHMVSLVDHCVSQLLSSSVKWKEVQILVNVDDYSRFTWVKCLRTYNGTEFVNQTLREYYEKVGISHETSVARPPQQNGVIERRNRTLIEAAHTMLIYAKALLFLWQKQLLPHVTPKSFHYTSLSRQITPYELLPDKPPDLSCLMNFSLLHLVLITQPLKLLLNCDIVAPEPAASTGSPSSTTVDQDAPSPSNSQTTPGTQSPIIPNDVEEDN